MTWPQINDFLRDASEAEALSMVEEERRSGKYRPVVLHRIVCRYTKMLVDRVRREKMTPTR